jgi:ribosomal protein S18 acetylase RimI-like enzyme
MPSVSLVAVDASERAAFTTMALSHFRELNSAFEPHADWKAGYFDRLLHDADLAARWIVVDGVRAGFIVYGVQPHRFLPRLIGAIYELYVHPDFRRRGVARAGARAAVDALLARGVPKIQLEIMDGNDAAFGLWRSLGFEKVSERFVLTGERR